MSDVTPPLAPPPSGEARTASATPIRFEREARALIGWLESNRAYQILASNVANSVPTAEQVERVQRAHEAVARRDDGVDQHEVVQELPTRLEAHRSALKGNPAARAYFDEGWEVALVDLNKVAAFQPLVFREHADDRVRDIHASDLEAIAGVALPVSFQVELSPQFDQTRQSWILASPNPNLRVVGQLAGQIPGQPEGLPAFGFFVTVTPSFMQVAEYRRRHFLRDGYHRAIGFLNRQIHKVPVLTRRFERLDEMVPMPGMLAQEAFLGPRPPLLPDYLDDTVAATVSVPAQQKMVIVQALEISPIG